MADQKIVDLAQQIVNYSINVEAGERVLITAHHDARELVKEIVKAVFNKNGYPFIKFVDNEVSSLLLEKSNAERIKLVEKNAMHEVRTYDAFINIGSSKNDYEGKNIPNEVHKYISKYVKKSRDIRINERKWVLLQYPTALAAHKAKMTTSDFYDFAMQVMNVDYSKMAHNIEPLKSLMEKTEQVRITGKGTDLTFSIKDMPIIPCVGDKNIPDGEIYCAPVKDSVNGYITYNTPSPYRGNVFTNVKLTFENGKIIKAEADNDNEKLQEIFNTDEGARFIGEFSIGLNPGIMHPMGDILYDEKIIGSIHFTPGQAYRDSYNGNDSAIHWDMVLIQRRDYGGGDIYFDEELIRKDGIFILEALKPLNSEQ